MKLKAIPLIFFALAPSVLWAQNVNNKAAETPQQKPQQNRAATVENFPTRQEAQGSWQKIDPPRESQTAKGPSNDIGPSGANTPGGSSRVTGSALPDPKINYPQEALDRVSPMTPEEIRKFEATLFERAQAMAETPGGPYQVRGIRVAPISFEPNAKPVEIEIAMNNGALVTFIDRNGKPLTVDGAKSFSYAFDVSVLQTEGVKAKGSASIEILPKALTGSGNLMVRLVGEINPILLQVKVGKSKEVDSLVQAIVPVITQANVLPGDRLTADGGMLVGEMQGFLMGIPPEGAVDVKVRQVANTTAWMWRDHLYLRTPHTIFSPGWFRRQAAVDGTAVYEMPLISVVRLGVDGREMEAILELPYIPASAGIARSK